MNTFRFGHKFCIFNNIKPTSPPTFGEALPCEDMPVSIWVKKKIDEPKMGLHATN